MIEKSVVYWTQTAKEDLRNIVQYIKADSESRAKQVYHEIKEKTDSLRQMPLRGRIVPELKYIVIHTYREMVNPHWRVIYKIEDDNLLILAVIDGRRNMEDILLDRLLG